MLALDYKTPLYNNQEAFDPSLMRLSTVSRLKEYCDSLFKVTNITNSSDKYELNYTNIVGGVVRKRFYWGYSCYSFNNNYMAVLFSKFTHWGYAATVIPDDILKNPNAACSQQSIVMMEVMKKKGFITRKIGFFGNNKFGHFAFEVYYKNSWHFHDPTLEPDTALLNKYGRPDFKFIAEHPDILLTAYKETHKDKSLLLDVFSHYSYGKPNSFLAPNAFIFHKITKILSNIIWIFFLVGYFVVKYLRKRPPRSKTYGPN